MRTALFSFLAIVTVSIIAMGCGSSYDCCFNKLYYSCKDQTTLNTCAGGDPGVCTRDATNDTHCTN